MDGFEGILGAARAGDEHAFATLWRDLQPPLLRYLRVIARPVAEDVASETWARVARDLDRFKGGESDFRGWLFTIARHRAIDWRRREGRRPADPQPDEAFEALSAPDDPAEVAVDGISTDAALALIATLPGDQAEVVMLRAVVGLDVPRVAALLGKRPGAVRVLAHRGLRRLAEVLEAPDPTPTRAESRDE